MCRLQEPIASTSEGDSDAAAPSAVQDSAKVMACLKRAIKVANLAKQQVRGVLLARW